MHLNGTAAKVNLNNGMHSRSEMFVSFSVNTHTKKKDPILSDAGQKNTEQTHPHMRDTNTFLNKPRYHLGTDTHFEQTCTNWQIVRIKQVSH